MSPEEIDKLRSEGYTYKILAIDTSGNYCGYAIFCYYKSNYYGEAILYKSGVWSAKQIAKKVSRTDITYAWMKDEYPWEAGKYWWPWINKVRALCETVIDIHEAEMFDDIVIECPMQFGTTKRSEAAHYTGAYAKMAVTACMLADSIQKHNAVTFMGKVRMIRPATWKGHLKKEHTQRRMRDRWQWTGSDHNEADAVGIGDWYLREVKRVYPVLPQYRRIFR